MNESTAPVFPLSYDGLFNLIDKATNHGMKLRQSDQTLINTSFVIEMGRVRDQFGTLIDEYHDLGKLNATAIEQQRAYGTLLLEDLDLARSGLIARVKRAMASKSVYGFYGASPNRKYTLSPVRLDLITAAEQFLRAEREVVAEAVLPPMVHPTFEEMQALIEEAYPIFIESRVVATAYRKNQEALRKYRKAVKLELTKLTRQLRYELRKLKKSTVRDYMRDFGFVFAQQSATEDENPDAQGNTADTQAENGDVGADKAEASQENRTAGKRRNTEVDRAALGRIRKRIHWKIYGTEELGMTTPQEQDSSVGSDKPVTAE